MEPVDVDLEVEALRTGPALVRFAYQLTHDPGLAEDVVQEALLRVLTASRRPARVQNPTAYLRRVVVNEFLAGRRRRTVSELLTDDPPERSDDGPSADTLSAERDRLWTALGTLPERQRVALVLRYYEQLSDVEIADVMQCRRPTVRTLVRRGLAALRTNPTVSDDHRSNEVYLP